MPTTHTVRFNQFLSCLKDGCQIRALMKDDDYLLFKGGVPGFLCTVVPLWSLEKNLKEFMKENPDTTSGAKIQSYIPREIIDNLLPKFENSGWFVSTNPKKISDFELPHKPIDIRETYIATLPFNNDERIKYETEKYGSPLKR